MYTEINGTNIALNMVIERLISINYLLIFSLLEQEDLIIAQYAFQILPFI